MSGMIGRKYMVVTDTDSVDEGTYLEIVDHRLSRTFKEDFAHYAQVHKDYAKNDTLSSQVTYQYEFLVKFEYPLEQGSDGSGDRYYQKEPKISKHNDDAFLDFLSEYCEELDKEKE